MVVFGPLTLVQTEKHRFKPTDVLQSMLFEDYLASISNIWPYSHQFGGNDTDGDGLQTTKMIACPEVAGLENFTDVQMQR